MWCTDVFLASVSEIYVYIYLIPRLDYKIPAAAAASTDGCFGRWAMPALYTLYPIICARAHVVATTVLQISYI